MIQFTTVSTAAEVTQMLALQRANHPSVLHADTIRDQGFVTVQHDPAVLLEMNWEAPSAIAKDGDQVVGYCLMMPRSFRDKVPVLEPMFALLDTLHWRGQLLATQSRWFVMGQVCVAAEYRGQGLFDGMYQHLRQVTAADYDCVITEVAARNTRSMRAHERVGFTLLHQYDDALTGETWQVIVWPFN
jgi:predicted N-acetyltransferase YhbS